MVWLWVLGSRHAADPSLRSTALHFASSHVLNECLLFAGDMASRVSSFLLCTRSPPSGKNTTQILVIGQTDCARRSARRVIYRRRVVIALSPANPRPAAVQGCYKKIPVSGSRQARASPVRPKWHRPASPSGLLSHFPAPATVPHPSRPPAPISAGSYRRE